MRIQQIFCVHNQLVRRLIVAMIAALLLWSGQAADVRAAVAPNGQYGQCGPYYLWYQVDPESALYGGDYVDLCEITFDVREVDHDFDFVYFTDTPTLRRFALDRNHDGISDLYFQLAPKLPRPTGTSASTDDTDAGMQADQSNPALLRWKPEHGCVRINLRDCWGPTFNERCGYAMISLQPRAGKSSGYAEIPVRVSKRCPPYGDRCDETLKITHAYSNCAVSAPQEFLVNKQVDNVLYTGTYYNATFNFTLTVLNIGQKRNNTLLTDIFTDGTAEGQLDLSKLQIECPSSARCTVSSITDRQLQIELNGLGINEKAQITYTLTGNIHEIPKDEVSYFINKAMLSNGNSAELTFGIRGQGNFAQRPERPRPNSGQHPGERQ